MTPAQLSQVEQLWKREGLSAGQIAAQLGRGVTRNMIMGVCHRRGWKRSEFINEANRKDGQLRGAKRSSQVRRLKGVQKAVTKPQRPVEQVSGITIAPIPLEALTPRSCRWIEGEPSEGFCGQTRVDGSPYCASHFSRAYTVQKRRA
jgi:hypothetical protein